MRIFGFVNMVLCLAQAILLFIQGSLGKNSRPKDQVSRGFGDNLLFRADALGALLAFEPIIVSLYCFSSRDYSPAGPWTNFSVFMLGKYQYQPIEGCSAYASEFSNLLCPRTHFEVCFLFHTLAVVFGSLLEATVFGTIILVSLLKFNKILQHVFTAVLGFFSIITLLIFLAALIVQVIYMFIAMFSTTGIIKLMGSYIMYLNFTVFIPFVIYVLEQFAVLHIAALGIVPDYVGSFGDNYPSSKKGTAAAAAAVAPAPNIVVIQGAPQPAYPPQGYPPPGGFPPPGAAPYPGGYPPQGYPPQGYPPQGYPPPGVAPYPGGYPPPQQGYLPPGPAPNQEQPVKIPPGSV